MKTETLTAARRKIRELRKENRELRRDRPFIQEYLESHRYRTRRPANVGKGA